MDEPTYRQLFEQFLFRYWGALHEALEAQSVTQARLAGSLFTALRREHDAFAALYTGPEREALHALGVLWQKTAAARHGRLDAPLTAEAVSLAIAHFERLFEALRALGEGFPKTRDAVIAAAPHGLPSEPLRADARS